jgi:hypothetical protein
MRVTAADEVRAIEADRFVLLAGTIVRGPLGLHSTYPGCWLSSLGAFLDELAGAPADRGKVEMDNRWNKPGRESSRAPVTVFPQLIVFIGDPGGHHSSTNT